MASCKNSRRGPSAKATAFWRRFAAGHINATRSSPGINRILDICERRRVDTVMAWQQDRFGEYPLPDVLASQLARFGTKLRSLDDGGEGEAAELHNMFSHWMARRERRKTARRSRMGKLEKARDEW